MTIFKESKTILFLSIPLIIGQLGQMLLGLVDSVMIARVGVTELAALTLANSIFFVPFVFGMGILTCISVRTSTARGRNDTTGARSVCRNGVYIGLILGIIIFTLAMLSSDLLEFLKQDPDVVRKSRTFYIILMASLIPGLVAVALKNHADALSRIWTAFWISMAGVLLNVLLNWVFIFGNLGAPALGLEGAGVATLIARCATVIAMLVWFKIDTSLLDWTPHKWLRKLDLTETKKLIKLGLPSGLQSTTEVGAFVATGLLIGRFGAEALAAQNVALTFAGLAFMIPLGLSIALTIRVGERIGLGQHNKLKTTFISGWLITLVFSCVTAAILLTFRHELASSFVKDAPVVISLATSFLVVAGIFQLVDCQQVASIGMLRGLEDTTIPAWMCLFSYWVIGIPTGYYFAFHRGMGPVAIWWGLALGLTVAAILLGIRLWKSLKHEARV